MKKFSVIIAVFALFMIGSTSVNVQASTIDIETMSPTGTKGVSHPDFTSAELKAVFKDISLQSGYTVEDVTSMYIRGEIVIERPSRNNYKAIITLADDGGFSQVLLGEIF